MMTKKIRDDNFRKLALLQTIQADPDISQVKLAESLGVAIGTVNAHLQRLGEQGFIRVEHVQRRKLRYVITAEGIALQEELTLAYIHQSFSLFRQVRQQVKQLLAELESAGINTVRLEGEGDVADVCRLTCFEQHFNLAEDNHAPVLVVDGLEIRLEMSEITQ